MDSARIEREAADWLARRDSGDWSEADAQAFFDWQNQSTSHCIAVIRIQTAWHNADRLQALGAGVPRGEVPASGSWRLSAIVDPDRQSPERVTSSDAERKVPPAAQPSAMALRALILSSSWLRALAAALVLAMGASSVWYFLRYDPHEYRSPIGDIKVVSLADGSVITLNTNTAIHVSLSPRDRRIDLERGEAFFEVAKDPWRPFIVSAAGERIVAVGTKFSVFRGAIDTEVVVTEGRVKVARYGRGAAIEPITELPAGSIAQAGPAGVVVKHASVAEAESYLSWRSGYITLRDTDLATAVTEFNRYNRKQLIIQDPSVGSLRIGVNLRATNVGAFVRVLEAGFPVQAKDEGDRIVLTAR